MDDITPRELKERLDSGESVMVVDVREVWEYDNYNIGSVNIPLGTLPNNLDRIEEYRDKEIIMMCRTGVRSANAKMYLEAQGFKKVRNLLDGIVGYSEL